MTVSRDELLGVARSAVDAGAGLLRRADRGSIHTKSDRDYATDLDHRIQGHIRRYLAETTPEFGFLGEESDDMSLDSTARSMWVLDPIDGTSNFIHGLPLCAVSLALVQDGEPVIGVVNAPFLGLEYYAVADQGAIGNDKPIKASNIEALGRAIVSIGDYAVGLEAESKNKRRIALTAALAATVERVRMFGSAALDLVWVAEGRTDACVMLSNKPWDTIAGVLIAREAGALVLDSTSRRHSLDSPDTIAASPAIADQLMALVEASIC
ncbi:inositol monophosphatase family protein [Nocardia gamkensis]|uniref:Inositol-1-monophosphatase n=1 Tax=Nocardia gamkensis TaxID=352869 RepID=A0A7X6L3W9_9NOCA|nr:inositol monophosphatase [Nocardia gamkensis]NQE65841.1 putative inositol 1-monophosphatase ImpA [Nocardia gamkensis]